MMEATAEIAKDIPPDDSEVIVITADEIEEEFAKFGEITDDQTMQKMRSLASVFTDAIESQISDRAGSLELTTMVANAVSQQMTFHEKGAGIATTPKQLDLYHQIKPEGVNKVSQDQENELLEGLDCKLPTFITGLTLEELAARGKTNLEVFIFHRRGSVHPVLVAIEPDKDSPDEDGAIKRAITIEYVNHTIPIPLDEQDKKGLTPKEESLIEMKYTRSTPQVRELSGDQVERLQKHSSRENRDGTFKVRNNKPRIILNRLRTATVAAFDVALHQA